MNTLAGGGTLGLENLSLSEATVMRLFLVQRNILPHLSKVACCKQNPNNQPRRNCKSLAFSLWPPRQCRVSPGVWSSWHVPVKELGFRLPHSTRGTTGVISACVLASSSFFTFVCSPLLHLMLLRASRLSSWHPSDFACIPGTILLPERLHSVSP